MSEPVITPRVARVILRHLDARKLRILYRTDQEIWPALIALVECAMADGGHELAIESTSPDDYRVRVLQAARRAKVSARTVIRAIDSGELEAEKLGPLWLISEASLRRWVARRERQERQVS
jgi:excisionase family DNA binding protein